MLHEWLFQHALTEKRIKRPQNLQCREETVTAGASRNAGVALRNACILASPDSSLTDPTAPTAPTAPAGVRSSISRDDENMSTIMVSFLLSPVVQLQNRGITIKVHNVGFGTLLLR